MDLSRATLQPKRLQGTTRHRPAVLLLSSPLLPMEHIANAPGADLTPCYVKSIMCGSQTAVHPNCPCLSPLCTCQQQSVACNGQLHGCC